MSFRRSLLLMSDWFETGFDDETFKLSPVLSPRPCRCLLGAVAPAP